MKSPVEIIFWSVAKSLMALAKMLGTTYNAVNVVVYYFLIPLSWIIMIDMLIGWWYFTAIYCGCWIGVYYLTRGRFKAWCDYIFMRSQQFLLSFKDFDLSYKVSSVIICVIIPLLVYALLFYFHHYGVVTTLMTITNILKGTIAVIKPIFEICCYIGGFLLIILIIMFVCTSMADNKNEKEIHNLIKDFDDVRALIDIDEDFPEVELTDSSNEESIDHYKVFKFVDLERDIEKYQVFLEDLLKTHKRLCTPKEIDMGKKAGNGSWDEFNGILKYSFIWKSEQMPKEKISGVAKFYNDRVVFEYKSVPYDSYEEQVSVIKELNWELPPFNLMSWEIHYFAQDFSIPTYVEFETPFPIEKLEPLKSAVAKNAQWSISSNGRSIKYHKPPHDMIFYSFEEENGLVIGAHISIIKY